MNLTVVRRSIVVAALAAFPIAGFDALPGESDQSFKIIQTTAPQFPLSLRARQLNSGEVRVTISVDPTGRLEDCMATSYSHPELARAALDALREWRYVPARQHGQPIGVRTEVVFAFENTGIVCSLTSGEALDRYLDLLTKPGVIKELYRPNELDVLPALVQTVAPRHPAPAAAGHEVVLDFLIDGNGQPRMPVVIASDDLACASAAVDALSQWRFSPAMKAGKPVAVRALQKFTFARRS